MTERPGSNPPDIEGELGVERAPLGREVEWLPAIESRGEGLFLAFRKAAVNEWFARAAVQERGRRLEADFQAWRADHEGSRREYPDMPYIMLHTLSHLLLTAVSLECGYPASSLRERVHASRRGFGILIYTATADAEGTLGGLVEAGRSRFPVDFEASAFGSVAVSSHVVGEAGSARVDNVVVIASPWAHFEWFSGVSEVFLESNTDGDGTIVLIDRTAGSPASYLDRIFSDQDGGATHPDRSLDLLDIDGDGNESDDAFIDVELTLLN